MLVNAGRSSIFAARRLRVVLAVVRRDYLITRSYRLPLVLDLFFGIANLMVFYFISESVEISTIQFEGAPSYFAFASVGVTVSVVVQATIGALSLRIREEQLTGTLEVLVAQPVTPSELSAGLGGFPFLFAVVRIIFYLTIATLVFGLDVSEASWIGVAAVLGGTAIALSAIGVLAGAFVLLFKQGAALAAVATFAMAVLSGAFFPPSILPGLFESIGEVMPTRFAFRGLRTALFEGADWWRDVAALVGFGSVTLPVSILAFRSALLLATRRGSLSQY